MKRRNREDVNRRKQGDAPDDVFFEDDERDEEWQDAPQETPEEKKLKIAKAYLAQLKATAEENEESDIDEAVIKKLKTDQDPPPVEIAKRLDVSPDDVRTVHSFYPASKWELTSLAVHRDASAFYSVDKNGGISIIDMESGQKTKIPFERDFQQLSRAEGGRAPWVSRTGSYGISKRSFVAAALTDDGKLLAVGGGDKHVHIFDTVSQKCIKSFSGHREAVSGLTFQDGTRKLFSCSYDRTVKIWNLDDMGYVDTLYGHQSEIFDIDMMHMEKLVTAGNDRTCRIWKTMTDSQLVFRAPTLSMECCRLLNGSSFVSASSDGIQLWNIAKKKPIAHVPCPSSHLRERSWIQSLATTHGADLVASGAGDGCVRLWSIKSDGNRMHGIEYLGGLEAEGFVTALHVSMDGRLVIAAVSRRPRLGAWTSQPTTNGIVLHRLDHKQ